MQVLVFAAFVLRLVCSLESKSDVAQNSTVIENDETQSMTPREFTPVNVFVSRSKIPFEPGSKRNLSIQDRNKGGNVLMMDPNTPLIIN